ncbi:MAG TPA: hypothetical protein VL404_08740 [Candidatus Eisenbacteria bacterium]|jgi:hypothetical protein|nr:hypothetical protein [Candidatus Eisenbacteria bacterium]
MIRRAAAVALFALAAPSACALAADVRPVSEYSSAGRVPFEAKMSLPDGPVRPGIFLPGVRVTIRNTSDTALVLRGARWDYRPEERTWRDRLPGRIDPNSDGSFLIDTSAKDLLSDRAFERALLRPGEEIELLLPLSPQIFGRHDLVVKYGLLGPGWEADTVLEELIPPKSPGKIKIGFYPADSVPAGKRGRFAVYAPTAEPGKPDPFAVYDAVIGFEFPFDKPPKEQELVPIARKAGIDLLNESWWAFYRQPLDAWIFVRDDGRASALHAGVYELLPRMDVSVPEELCQEGRAASLEIGGEKADLPCGEVWEALERALQKDAFVARRKSA